MKVTRNLLAILLSSNVSLSAFCFQASQSQSSTHNNSSATTKQSTQKAKINQRSAPEQSGSIYSPERLGEETQPSSTPTPTPVKSASETKTRSVKNHTATLAPSPTPTPKPDKEEIR